MSTPTAGSRWWSSGRSREPQDGDVVAVRYEECVAKDLAEWCEGQVVLAEGVDGSVATTVYVPTLKGPRPALPGDWIVRDPDGSFRSCSHEEFTARYEPQDPAAVPTEPVPG